jgi:hypothetical protein
MSNPFDTAEAAEVEELGSVEEDLDVEALGEASEDEAEDTVEAAPAAPKGKSGAAKEKKGPARPAVPEGYIMPVAFARELTKHLAARGAENKHGKIHPDTNVIPPQQVYSMMRTNGSDSKNPFPVHELEGFTTLLKLEEALAWWDAKDARVSKSKAEKAAKAAKKAEKAESAAEGEDNTPDAPAEAE